ncbi:MAG TPA: ImmA/IrrE family metallo-endopeptidase [Gammaproteobacteria bacterium]
MKIQFDKSRLRALIDREPDFDVSAGLRGGNQLLPDDVFLIAEREFDLKKFPLREILSRGWIKASKEEVASGPLGLINRFFYQSGETVGYMLCRKSANERSDSLSAHYSLLAWMTRVLFRARSECCSAEYSREKLNRQFFQELAQFSVLEDGPRVAKEFLSAHGIALIIEKHLPGTNLDGAAAFSRQGKPVIGMTLRYDRLDNFWFTLFHELAHIYIHLANDSASFFDDLENESDDPKELEANRFAKNTLIPRHIWARSDAFRYRTPAAVYELATQLNINPAIVAGRIQKETGRYDILRGIVDKNSVRALFADAGWS